MIAFLPMLILGVPLVLALIDLMAMRSSRSDDGDGDYESPKGRYAGTHAELRRGEDSSPVVGQPAHRFDVPANVS